MSTTATRKANVLARRFSHVCIISLAALVTSGTGLLAYVNDDPGPPWLRSMVLVSAAMVAISFVGWLVMSLSAFAHEMSMR